jgi:hypothetical protein
MKLSTLFISCEAATSRHGEHRLLVRLVDRLRTRKYGNKQFANPLLGN